MPLRRSVAVVMPVRDGASHVPLALEAMMSQVKALDGEVIIVDDASTDDTAAVAEAAGARVVHRKERGGPYVARNDGWRSSTAETIVFTDVRNRAEPEWLEKLLGPLEDPGVAIVGGTVRMAGGNKVAERWARRTQLLDVGMRLTSDWLPYVPTASLATRRSVLEHIDGFRAVRSAGDVDFCWRTQLAGLGVVATAAGSVMLCDPRTTVREVLRQWTRYGYSNHDVRTRFGPEGCPPPQPLPRRTLAVSVVRSVGSAVLRRRDIAVELLDQARLVAYARSYRRAASVRDRAKAP